MIIKQLISTIRTLFSFVFKRTVCVCGKQSLRKTFADKRAELQGLLKAGARDVFVTVVYRATE